MKIYSLALFLVIFGAVTGTLNAISIYDQPLPVNTRQIENTEEVWESVNQTVYGQMTWIFWLPIIIIQLAKILFYALTTAATIIPLLLSYNVPMEICLMVQTPIWFIYAAGAIQWITGHPFKGNE